MNISRELLDDLLAHVLEDPANEICGVVAVQDGAGQPELATAAEVYRAANKHKSPMRFEIEPAELLALYDDIEERGWRIGGIYHSHVRSAPYPSQTDINFAANWPGVEWIIVGLAGEGASICASSSKVDDDASPQAEPEVRSYLIEDGVVREVPLQVG